MQSHSTQAPATVRIRLFACLLGLLGRLPLPWLQMLGLVLAEWLWLSRSRMALVSRENIRLCFPQLSAKQQIKLARSSLRETCKTIVETAMTWTRPTDQCLTLIKTVEGEAAVKAYLNEASNKTSNKTSNKSRGLVFVMPHLGNWELINHYLGHHYGLTHMFQPNKAKDLNDYIQSCRRRTGTLFVPADKSGIRAQLAILKAGACIGTMPDQEPDIHSGRFAAFFDQQALSNPLVAGFINKTGAKAVTAVCERLPGGKGFKLVFRTIKFSNNHSTDAADPEQINSAMQTAIEACPDQYLWSYKRFRTRPAGEIDHYQFGQHLLRVSIQRSLISGLLYLSNHLKLETLRATAKYLNWLAPLLLRRRLKIAKINLRLCQQPAHLTISSQQELIKTGLEAAKIWRAPDLSPLIEDISGLANLASGTLVLTPPMGNRELVMRYLGETADTIEYYHPNTNTAIDLNIRASRNRAKIRLVPHNQTGREQIVRHLKAGNIATLCPDQQPRVRGGRFVTFFGFSGLTSLAIPEIVAASNCQLVYGVALRTETGFKLEFTPVRADPACADPASANEVYADDLLRQVNLALEGIIEQDAAQYRWSDKRFNIRPPGETKVYR